MKLHPTIMGELDGVTCQTPFGNWSKVFDFNFNLLGKQLIIFIKIQI